MSEIVQGTLLGMPYLCSRGSFQLTHSLIAQFDHLASTSFNQPILDAGEKQLGLVEGFDYDLDNFAAAIGYARQAVKTLAEEDGELSLCPRLLKADPADVEVMSGESTIESALYEPVQRILDQVRSMKGSSR